MITGPAYNYIIENVLKANMDIYMHTSCCHYFVSLYLFNSYCVYVSLRVCVCVCVVCDVCVCVCVCGVYVCVFACVSALILYRRVVIYVCLYIYVCLNGLPHVQAAFHMGPSWAPGLAHLGPIWAQLGPIWECCLDVYVSVCL